MEDNKAVEGCAAQQKEAPEIESDFSTAGNAKVDAGAIGGEQSKGVGKRASAYRVQDMIEWARVTSIAQVLAHNHTVRASRFDHLCILLLPHNAGDARSRQTGKLTGQMTDTA